VNLDIVVARVGSNECGVERRYEGLFKRRIHSNEGRVAERNDCG